MKKIVSLVDSTRKVKMLMILRNYLIIIQDLIAILTEQVISIESNLHLIRLVLANLSAIAC